MPWSRTLKSMLIVGFALVSLATTVAKALPQEARIERLTPILVVDSIEAVVPFWEGLGFRATNPNHVEGKLAFIAFAKEGYTIHYQTIARLERDIPGVTETLAGSTSLLYLAVDDLDAVIAALGDAEVVVPRRNTPWGADEIYVREPGGHLIGFAEFGRD